MKSAFIFLADGFEEIEALAPVDILRRGGIEVVTVSLNEDCLSTSSRGIPVLADMSIGAFLSEIALDSDDVMVFPGGMPGTRNLASCASLMDMMRKHYMIGGTLAAICAAPSLVLASKLPADILSGRSMTCFAGMEEPIISAGAKYVEEGVVEDGRLITGQGAGFCIEFALSILKHMTDVETAQKVASSMML